MFGSNYQEKAKKVIYSDFTNGFTPDDFADLCLAAADQAMIPVASQEKIKKILEEEGRGGMGKMCIPPRRETKG